MTLREFGENEKRSDSLGRQLMGRLVWFVAAPLCAVFEKQRPANAHCVVSRLKRFATHCLTAVVLLPCLSEGGALVERQHLLKGKDGLELSVVLFEQEDLSTARQFNAGFQDAKRVSEGGSELTSGSVKGVEFRDVLEVLELPVRDLHAEAIRCEYANERASNAEAASDQRKFVSGKFHTAAVLLVLFGGLVGIAIGLTIARAAFWLFEKPNVRLVRQTPACRGLSARRQGWADRQQNVPRWRQNESFAQWTSFATVRCYRTRAGVTGNGQPWRWRKRSRSAGRQRTGSPGQPLRQPLRESPAVGSFSYAASGLNSDMPNV